jgi:energy-converting hydrogenase Eha subunit A
MTNLAPWVVVIAGIVVLWISLSGQLVSWIALLGIVLGALAVVLGLRWRRRLVGAMKL